MGSNISRNISPSIAARVIIYAAGVIVSIMCAFGFSLLPSRGSGDQPGEPLTIAGPGATDTVIVFPTGALGNALGTR